MKKIIEIIENRAKELDLRKEDLASIIDLSRQALYAAFYSNESFRVKDLIKLADVLKLDLSELFAHELETKSKKIDYHALSSLPKILEYKGISDLDVIPILNPGNLTSNLDLENIYYYNLYWFCKNYKIPFDLFIKDELRKEFKRVEVADYIKYQNLISKNNIESNYIENFHYHKIHLIKLINQIFKPNRKKADLKNQDIYIPFEHDPGTLLNLYRVSFITEECNTPLIILTATPDSKIFMSGIANKLAEQVYDNYLKKYKIKLKEIVWGTFQYYYKGGYDIGLAKFPHGFKGGIEWFDIDNDRFEKEFTIQELKEFLNYIN